ncbi:MAG: GTP-binding protein, partial [Verrucomicrobiota bacterium]
GASGYLIVVDGTRRDTLNVAKEIVGKHHRSLSGLPSICVINKLDLRADWEVTEQDVQELRNMGWQIAFTSAKHNETVESVFGELTANMLGGSALAR